MIRGLPSNNLEIDQNQVVTTSRFHTLTQQKNRRQSAEVISKKNFKIGNSDFKRISINGD
jgi:uncharacterized protein YjbK